MTLFEMPQPVQWKPILAATAWPTNAEMIVDCVRLGYLRDEWRTLDPTYGRGIWWNIWRPADLVAHDLATDGIDFRALPYEADSFDAAVFDPPYIHTGTPTELMADFRDRFGLNGAPVTGDGVRSLILAGLSEVLRVVRPEGFVLVKCMDYIASRRLQLITNEVTNRARELGATVFDRLVHLRGIGPQPWDHQEHARANFSTLLVLRAGEAPTE